MEKRRIGSLEVTLAGLGCNNFGKRISDEASLQVIEAALEAGVNFFDTADIYGQTRSEELLGRALAGRRKQVIIATKFGIKLDEQRLGGASPKYVQRAAEDSLRRLNTDYIDLYQIHQPDPNVPIADTLGALNRLVEAGKVREIGCSNFSLAQLREAEAAVAPGAARFVSLQNEYSLLHREPEQGVLAECERAGCAFLPYFPLANGLLTGKYRRGTPPPAGTRMARENQFARYLSDRNFAIVQSLTEFAESRGHTILELAMSWLASRPAVASVIAGATKPEQVRANAAAVGWRLTAAELAQVDSLVAQPVGN